jgi:transposase-like protein
MVACPRCTSDEVKRPSFTWWGGALGATLLRHHVCRLCRFAFNAKTGASNRRAVVFYVLVSNTVVFAILSGADHLMR